MKKPNIRNPAYHRSPAKRAERLKAGPQVGHSEESGNTITIEHFGSLPSPG